MGDFRYLAWGNVLGTGKAKGASRRGKCPGGNVRLPQHQRLEAPQSTPANHVYAPVITLYRLVFLNLFFATDDSFIFLPALPRDVRDGL